MVSSISCLGSGGKYVEGKEAVKNTTLGPDNTDKGSTEYDKRLYMYTAMSLTHDFDNN